MSVVDDLRGLESRVVARLKELRPMVDEYNELEQIAARLGLDAGTQDAGGGAASRRPRSGTRTVRRAGPARTAKSGGGGTRRARRSRTGSTGGGAPASAGASAGERQQQIAELVTQRPGITVRELAGELGVDPTSLYRNIHRLESAGTIKKQGRALTPA
jgi:hypothetical protein